MDDGWYRMTAVEKCEVLRARVKDLESDDGLSVTNLTLMDLARRVAEIEKGHTETMLGHFHGNHARVSGFTPGSEGPRHEYVECGELARLRRVEKAAREVSARCMLPSWRMPGMDALRAALDSEAER